MNSSFYIFPFITCFAASFCHAADIINPTAEATAAPTTTVESRSLEEIVADIIARNPERQFFQSEIEACASFVCSLLSRACCITPLCWCRTQSIRSIGCPRGSLCLGLRRWRGLLRCLVD
ncbi:MAG: hypothetical protein SFY80_09035 [Verrucomicrobiota bacterium]|nr:hypothetical protein [Verrucomicrobiota bacterium]